MITIITKLNPTEFEKVEKLPYQVHKKRRLFSFIPKELRKEMAATLQVTLNGSEVDVPELYKRDISDGDTLVIRSIPETTFGWVYTGMMGGGMASAGVGYHWVAKGLGAWIANTFIPSMFLSAIM